MPTYGLTATGFAMKPLAQIIADMQAAQLAGISPSLDLQPPDPLAVTTQVVAEAVYEVWALAGALYNGMDPDGAATSQLTSLALITGTPRDAATYTVVVGATVNTNASFSALAGTMFARMTGDTVHLFTNNDDVSNPAGGNVAVTFTALDTGAISVPIGALAVIASPLAGWNSITNAAAGLVGSAVMTDAALRLRRTEELALAGTATAAALRADILSTLQLVNGATTSITIPHVNGGPFTLTVGTESCQVFANDTDAVDANGIPAHAIECVVYQPGFAASDTTALVALILSSKSSGITTYSGLGTFATATDDQGFSQAIYYTRPATVAINFVVTLVQATGAGVTSGQVQTAITDFCNGSATLPAYFQPGMTVYASAISAAIFAALNVVGLPARVVSIVACTVNAGASVTCSIRHVPILGTFTIGIT